MAKVKKRKLNFKKFFGFIFTIVAIFLVYFFLSKRPIRNIVITGTSNISDEEIMMIANLEDYPSFIKTSRGKIKKNILKIPLVKDVKVHKHFFEKLVIEVTEYKVLFKVRSTDEYVLEGNKKLSDIDYVGPVLINYVQDDVLSKFVSKFEKMDNNIINKVSEIEYSPTKYDKERFILYMTDENTVHVTLAKLKNLNNYNKIKEQLGTNKGILYLDSGNYFEIKE